MAARLPSCAAQLKAASLPSGDTLAEWLGTVRATRGGDNASAATGSRAAGLATCPQPWPLPPTAHHQISARAGLRVCEVNPGGPASVAELFVCHFASATCATSPTHHLYTTSRLTSLSHASSARPSHHRAATGHWTSTTPRAPPCHGVPRQCQLMPAWPPAGTHQTASAGSGSLARPPLWKVMEGSLARPPPTSPADVSGGRCGAGSSATCRARACDG